MKTEDFVNDRLREEERSQFRQIERLSAELSEAREAREAAERDLALTEALYRGAGDEALAHFRRAETAEAQLALAVEAFDELMSVACRSAETFRLYEELHLAKSPPDEGKAAANRRVAEVCESALRRAASTLINIKENNDE